jgi:isoquinoline 1-oxidoreductase beta subunit
MTAIELNRREFVRAGITGAAGLTIAIHLPACAAPGDRAPAPTPFRPNAWLRVGLDGGIVVVVDKSEMGQGVLTSLPQIIVEELDGDWSKVRIEQAPVGPEYVNLAYGIQATGGSSSVRSSMQALREAGAKARAMLVSTAAQEWGIEPSACHTDSGYVMETAGRRRKSYGDLVEAAATLAEPESVELKDPKDFKLIGKPIRRLDIEDKVTGRAGFGIDTDTEGLLVAVVARCPTYGGTVADYDDQAALAVAGVRQVVQIDSGIAVVADGYWQATQGRNALEVTWDRGTMAGMSSEDISKKFKALAGRSGVVARDDGNAGPALRRAAKRIGAWTIKQAAAAADTTDP